MQKVVYYVKHLFPSISCPALSYPARYSGLLISPISSQPLSHPTHSSSQAPLHRIPLARLLRIPTNKARMLHAREVPILERHAFLLPYVERPRLEMLREHRIDLWRQDLHRHPRRDRVNVSFHHKRWVANGYTVQQWLGVTGWVELFGCEEQACPAAVAVADGTDFGILSSQVAGTCKNFGRPGLAGIGREVGIEVELGPRRLLCGQNIAGQWVIVEAAMSGGLVNRSRRIYDPL